jgi:hypothetical protein
MTPFKFRASSLAEIMGDPMSIDPQYLTDELASISRKTKKTDEDKALLAPLKLKSLSAGAKTAVENMAKELVYGYTRTFSSKYTEKGLAVENDSIDLYNSVFFTDYTKNTERKSNEWVTGECDIFTGKKIIDIKSSWSLDTFPATAAAAADTTYEWQTRVYMWLWDVEDAEVAFCLVNTPEELIGYEPPEYHYVDQIPEVLRITRVHYKRDQQLEERIKVKVEAARRYLDELVQRIAAEHS